MQFDFLPDEVFFGGAVTSGVSQPYKVDYVGEIDLTFNNSPNQMMPLLVSTGGRWIYKRDGMRISFQAGKIIIDEDVLFGKVDGGLREAYLHAMSNFFPFHTIKLDNILFERPVYNTWIELTFNQSQDKILDYAHSIIENKLPAGLLIIDDGWTNYYGDWTFSKNSFADAEAMIRELHELGFKVMVWVCPFITADTCEYRYLEKNNLLLKTDKDEVHIAKWWNGHSAILDMRKEKAAAWLKTQLDNLMNIGVDGFKFDAGDSFYYPHDGNEHSLAWAEFGEQYSLNEFRVTYGAGGYSLVQRLCDKDHSWNERGLASLVPNAIVQGLTGHPFLSPDMIGGGEYLNFYEQKRLDADLFVRWAQIAAMMPIMQFSAAPWRVLDSNSFKKILEAVALRKRYQVFFQESVSISISSGEPILRPLAYNFNDRDCFGVIDQFMIGERLMVVPLLEREACSRAAYFPKGRWMSDSGAEINSDGNWQEIDCDGVSVYVLLS